MPFVEHISDTALWIAAIRAQESERTDALFFDPFARELAGPRGFAIANRTPRGKVRAWAIALRTRAMDDMVIEAMKEGFDCVLNLASGLDTRAFRLALPAELHWVEVDLPALLDYKKSKMQDVSPKCQLSQIALDLTDEVARTALFERLSGEHKKVLVISEGLLLYLREEQVAALARAITLARTFAAWLIDFVAPALLRRMRNDTSQMFAVSKTQFQFAPNDLTWFEPHGWVADEVRAIYNDAIRFRRLFWWHYALQVKGLFQSKAQNEAFQRMYLTGCARMERIDRSS